jgi:hypothetical protein
MLHEFVLVSVEKLQISQISELGQDDISNVSHQVNYLVIAFPFSVMLVSGDKFAASWQHRLPQTVLVDSTQCGIDDSESGLFPGKYFEQSVP